MIRQTLMNSKNGELQDKSSSRCHGACGGWPWPFETLSSDAPSQVSTIIHVYYCYLGTMGNVYAEEVLYWVT
jgi:hypothetical protein